MFVIVLNLYCSAFPWKSEASFAVQLPKSPGRTQKGGPYSNTVKRTKASSSSHSTLFVSITIAISKINETTNLSRGVSFGSPSKGIRGVSCSLCCGRSRLRARFLGAVVMTEMCKTVS